MINLYPEHQFGHYHNVHSNGTGDHPRAHSRRAGALDHMSGQGPRMGQDKLSPAQHATLPDVPVEGRGGFSSWDAWDGTPALQLTGCVTLGKLLKFLELCSLLHEEEPHLLGLV